jgi:phage host-nuclease inhibitor protein Gam
MNDDTHIDTDATITARDQVDRNIERKLWLEDMARQALVLKHRIHALYAALAQVEEALKEGLKDGERIVTPTGTVLLLETQSVSFTDVEAVQRALGSGFSRLVKTKMVYQPDAALSELASDAQSPVGQALRQGLTLQRRRSLLYNFRSGAPAKPCRSTPLTASGND